MAKSPGAADDKARDDWAINNPIGTGPFTGQLAKNP